MIDPAAQPREEPVTEGAANPTARTSRGGWHRPWCWSQWAMSLYESDEGSDCSCDSPEAAAHATERRPDRPPIVFCHDPACGLQRFGAHPFHATERPDPTAPIHEEVRLVPPYRAYWSQILTDVIYDAIHHPPGGPKNVPSGQIAEAVMDRLLRAATERPRTEPLPRHTCRQGIEPCAACEAADAIGPSTEPLDVSDHGDEVHWWDWCSDKAPGLDNGMYDVVCSLRKKHKGDEHRLEAGGRIVARWPRLSPPAATQEGE